MPRWRRMEQRVMRWLTTAASSWPVWRASADPIFLICTTATECHPPRLSATMGMKARPLAELSCPPHLPVMGHCCGMPWCDSSICPCKVLKGVGDSHIKCSIVATSPVADEKISRASVVARQKSSLLPYRRSAEAAVSKRASLSVLCQEMRWLWYTIGIWSPPLPPSLPKGSFSPDRL